MHCSDASSEQNQNVLLNAHKSDPVRPAQYSESRFHRVSGSPTIMTMALMTIR